MSGPDIPLGQKAVTNAALLFHELATNALKYGALANPTGQVMVECSVEAEDVCIVWREVGVAVNIENVEREGFGSRLTTAAVTALGGSLSRRFTGTGIEIQVTLSRSRICE